VQPTLLTTLPDRLITVIVSPTPIAAEVTRCLYAAGLEGGVQCNV
jgi:hypothetical protein